jgi:geranylgeranyl reductase family protein
VRSYDAIVVGAGPAGSVTAYRLASAGASVLLLDKARFPRDKPCGGGVTIRALKQLPFGIDPVVEAVVDRFELRLRHRRGFSRRAPAPLALMTQRRRLDAYLVEQAVAAGAEFRDGVRVARVAQGEVDGDTAVVVIGADGANGVTARSLGLRTDREHGVALEGNLANEAVDAERFAHRLVLEFGTVPGGYGWVFPKGDHVNVGVGGWETEGPRLREHLARLCEAHGLDVSALTQVRGHRLPLRRQGAALAEARVALVGDAAGLVDPLSGDGMYEAFLSANLAARHALELLAGERESFDDYAAELEERLAPLVRASWGAKLALDHFPRLTFNVARAPFLWDLVVRLMRGDVAAPREASGPVKIPLNVLKRIAKAATVVSVLAALLAGAAGGATGLRIRVLAETPTPPAGSAWAYYVRVSSAGKSWSGLVDIDVATAKGKRIDFVGRYTFARARLGSYIWNAADQGKTLLFRMRFLEGGKQVGAASYTVRVR